VPARIKLPGGKPRRFPWRAIGADEQPKAAAPKPNGTEPKITEKEKETSEQVTA